MGSCTCDSAACTCHSLRCPCRACAPTVPTPVAGCECTSHRMQACWLSGKQVALGEHKQLDGPAPLVWSHDPLLVLLVLLPQEPFVEGQVVRGDGVGDDSAQLGRHGAAALHVVAHGVEEARVVRLDDAPHDLPAAGDACIDSINIQLTVVNDSTTGRPFDLELSLQLLASLASWVERRSCAPAVWQCLADDRRGAGSLGHRSLCTACCWRGRLSRRRRRCRLRPLRASFRLQQQGVAVLQAPLRHQHLIISDGQRLRWEARLEVLLRRVHGACSCHTLLELYHCAIRWDACAEHDEAWRGGCDDLASVVTVQSLLKAGWGSRDSGQPRIQDSRPMLKRPFSAEAACDKPALAWKGSVGWIT
jgi:hypothetical protein